MEIGWPGEFSHPGIASRRKKSLFAGLWHGRSLAVTVVWITAFISLGLFLLGRNWPPDPEPGPRGEGHRDEAG
jgi:hypothetical protein